MKEGILRSTARPSPRFRQAATPPFFQPKLRVDTGLQRQCAHCEQEEKTIQRKESVYEDVADPAVKFGTEGGQAQYEGHVDHAEYRTEADRQAHAKAIRSSRIPVRFNESTCQLVVPLTVRFINQTAANPTTCGDINGRVNDPVRPASAAVYTDAVRRFMNDVPAALNGWYRVVLDGKSCSSCREVPVVVQFTQVSSGPADRTVVVTGNNGRSYVTGDGSTVALCGSDAQDSDILTHEAGHFALGAGDEYHETEGQRPAERERLGEYSRMAQDAPNRLLEFHERHFAFAAAFMRAMYPACQPRLERVRSAKVEFTIPFGMYGFSPKIGQGDGALSLGLQLGIPLMRMRRLSLTLGPTFSYLILNKDFLAGFRAGLEGRVSLGNLGPLGTAGLGFRAFGEGGAKVDFSKPLRSSSVGSYLEAGVGLDFRLGEQGKFGLEAAKGAFDPGGTSAVDYYRFGARIGVAF
jgi:hypothetical protein